MTTVEQNRIRRLFKTGVTAYDKDLACPGYVLFAPLYGHHTYLMNLDGMIVHQWEHEHVPGMYSRLSREGNLLYMSKVQDETWDIFPIWALFKGGVLQELDWEGNILWEHRDPFQHHDARRTASGGYIYPSLEQVPPDLAAKVQGGLDMDDDPMWADVIVEIDRDGNTVWEWHAIEHMDPATDKIAPNVQRWEWTHGNTVVPLENDQVLVSFRNTSTVGIIDKASGNFTWKIGDDILAGQHDPSLLPNGNILIYDNGTYRTDDWLIYSRVVEINPKTNEIEWEYRDAPYWDFFSATVSGAQRLPNGNTLITEGVTGRLFQVTPDGKIVWEYVNPEFHINPRDWEINMIFRGTHFMAEDLPDRF